MAAGEGVAVTDRGMQTVSEQLGKIERPSVEEYKAGRKLYFVPLVFAPEEFGAELAEMVSRYWEQVQSQLAGMESKLGKISKIYHELIATGGEDGAKAIEDLSKGSFQIARARLDSGADLHPIESTDIFTEFMDWSKCLSVGLENPRVFDKVWQFYDDARKKRNEYIAKQIDESLKPEESGILVLREGHSVQFPTDIQVFYVAPPALDEMKRWYRDQQEAAARKSEEAKEGNTKA
ncbi:MAG: hypothetical protein HY671_00225 [Chloroflexi bacterium]|nr:hypothetical protein [Chloroflexota bacterium]